MSPRTRQRPAVLNAVEEATARFLSSVSYDASTSWGPRWLGRACASSDWGPMPRKSKRATCEQAPHAQSRRPRARSSRPTPRTATLPRPKSPGPGPGQPETARGSWTRARAPGSLLRLPRVAWSRLSHPGASPCGPVWPGMARPCVAWPCVAWPRVAPCGPAWPGVAWPCVVQPCVAWPGVAQCGVAWRSVAWPGVAWPGVARCGPALCGPALCGVALCGVARRGVAPSLDTLPPCHWSRGAVTWSPF